eukprot:COSAG02_NODE_8516_length_2540_cov_5.095043_2_plen_187_part_00
MQFLTPILHSKRAKRIAVLGTTLRAHFPTVRIPFDSRSAFDSFHSRVPVRLLHPGAFSFELTLTHSACTGYAIDTTSTGMNLEWIYPDPCESAMNLGPWVRRDGSGVPRLSILILHSTVSKLLISQQSTHLFRSGSPGAARSAACWLLHGAANGGARAAAAGARHVRHFLNNNDVNPGTGTRRHRC